MPAFLSILKKAKIDIPDLVIDSADEGLLTECSTYLDYAKILTKKNVESLIQHIQHSKSIPYSLQQLHKENILNQDNYELVVENPNYSHHLTYCLITLNHANILTATNRTILKQNADAAEYIQSILNDLNETGNLTQVNFDLINQVAKEPHIRNFAYGIGILENNTILTQENFEIIVRHSEHSESLARSLKILKQAEILTSENLNILEQHPKFAIIIAESLAKLKAENISILDYGFMIVRNPQYAHFIATGLRVLKDAGILTPENTVILNQNAKYADALALVMQHLHTADILTSANIAKFIQHIEHIRIIESVLRILAKNAILKQQNFELVINNSQDAEKLWSGLEISDSDQILNQENFKVLAKNAKYSKELAKAIAVLKWANTVLNWEEKVFSANLSFLAIHAQYAEHMAHIIVTLITANLYSEKNLSIVGKQERYASVLNSSLNILADGEILNQQNFELFVKHPELGESGARIMKILSLAKILTSDNYITLIQFAKYNYGIELALEVLQDANLLNQSNFITLIKHAQYAFNIAKGLEILEANQILTQKNFSTLVNYDENAEQMASGMVCLNGAKLLSPNNCTIIGCSPLNARSIAEGMVLLSAAGMFNSDNSQILSLNPRYAKQIAICLVSFEPEYLATLKINIKDNRSFANLILFLTFANLSDEAVRILVKFKNSQEVYQYVIHSSDTDLFNHHSKIAAFFIAYHAKFEKEVYSLEINKLLDKIVPKSLGQKLAKILKTLGANNFMPNADENITIGFEVEYTRIPNTSKKLTEFVMDVIQTDWLHPGDSSVIADEKDTYSGEATTPIISTNNQLMAAMVNVAFLNSMGGATNSSCGLHIHIGVSNMNTPAEFKEIEEQLKDRDLTYTNYQLEFVKQLLKIYKREEVKFSFIEREANLHAQQVTIPQNLTNIDKLTELINIINPENRYFEINLRAFTKHGTIEIRRFLGTTEESQIYATTAMVVAMAKEAKERTNHTFRLKLESHEETKQDKSALPLFFTRQQQTERNTELFKLRVKSLQETKLILVDKEPSLKQSNTVYLFLNKEDNNIGYVFCKLTPAMEVANEELKDEKVPIKEKMIEKKGVIENDKRFAGIITKMHQGQKLTLEETNQILSEISVLSGALISHRVEKLAANSSLYRLRSNR